MATFIKKHIIIMMIIIIIHLIIINLIFGFLEGSKRRKRIEGSIGGDIPEKYYVVTNDDLLRVKYVLVYASRDKYLK